MIKQDITVAEGNQPTVQIQCMQRSAAGLIPYPGLGSFGFEFIVKLNIDTPDTLAMAKYTSAGGSISLTDPTNGVVTITTDGAATANPGGFAYHFDALLPKRITVQYGAWIVRKV